MKKIKYYIFGALASMAALTSCDADFTGNQQESRYGV